jgi:aquaporin Z
VSGANYNPAVSFALALRGALPYKDALFYAAIQFLASVVAGCVCLLVFIDDVQKNKPKHTAQEEKGDGSGGSGGVYGSGVIGHPSVNTERFSLLSAFTAEAAYTFALCFAVLNVATTKQDKAVANNQFFGLAVGFTVMAGACSAGPVSGGAFNPAVGFGLPLCAGEFEFIPLYLMGPLTGAAIASFFYYLTNFKVTIYKSDFLKMIFDSHGVSCPRPNPFTGVQDRVSRPAGLLVFGKAEAPSPQARWSAGVVYFFRATDLEKANDIFE